MSTQELSLSNSSACTCSRQTTDIDAGARSGANGRADALLQHLNLLKSAQGLLVFRYVGSVQHAFDLRHLYPATAHP